MARAGHSSLFKIGRLIKRGLNHLVQAAEMSCEELEVWRKPHGELLCVRSLQPIGLELVAHAVIFTISSF